MSGLDKLRSIFEDEFQEKGELFKDDLDPCTHMGNAFISKCETRKKYFGIDFRGLRFGFSESIDPQLNDRVAGILPLEEFESL